MSIGKYLYILALKMESVNLQKLSYIREMMVSLVE